MYTKPQKKKGIAKSKTYMQPMEINKDDCHKL